MVTKIEQQLYEQVAEQCVTPERFGKIAVQSEVLVENLRGLWEE